MKKLVVTGSSGLIGSECVVYFESRGWLVHGIDNNMRKDFFGPDGDTAWNLARIKNETEKFTHHNLDIRDRAKVLGVINDLKPDFVIHCAAQPSHDLAASRPFDDFDVNAMGTMNLLEATRQFIPESTFCFMSTNKVYGDAPNELPFKELETRWEYSDEKNYAGIDESMRIDSSTHSLFGANKVAADIMVQEYGRYFQMKTGCFRGGCLTGPNHSAAEAHGFLAYLVKCVMTGRPYKIFGYKGKQVRDNIHSFDVCTALESFYNNPQSGAVYNIGGGRDNSVSILEAIDTVERITGKKMDYEYADKNRVGDHICYISNIEKAKNELSGWGITKSLEDIFTQIVKAHKDNE